MEFITYHLPKSNSFGHGLGRMKSLDLHDRIMSFSRHHNALIGNTSGISAGFHFKTPNIELLNEINTMIISETKDAPTVISQSGLHDNYINYQWSGYQLPRSLLEYFSNKAPVFKEYELDFDLHEDLIFKIHHEGQMLAEYSRFHDVPDANGMGPASHINVIYGMRPFIQPSILFPVCAYNARLEEMMQIIESCGLFKFNVRYLQYNKISEKGKHLHRHLNIVRL